MVETRERGKQPYRETRRTPCTVVKTLKTRNLLNIHWLFCLRISAKSWTTFCRDRIGCLRCLLLVMCTYPFAKKALTLYLARSEGHERYFGCNLMQCKVLASSHQHLIAEAPVATPPSSLSCVFLRRVLLHERQCRAYGGLSAATRRRDRLG